MKLSISQIIECFNIFHDKDKKRIVTPKIIKQINCTSTKHNTRTSQLLYFMKASSSLRKEDPKKASNKLMNNKNI